ncbi:hypothetical protein FDI14_gp002 [Mycobacterium phage SirDuracell]|uniref:Uncharacterized protein n=11 Tax=Viruses TaxID=10239 RepID=G1DHT8_9CAUD|nr:hypothetical protein Kostya_2 [Mycobacterium phage Kostya]YP_008051480.1 hypothetical protein PBI_MURPHY_1 [Mycobacterium phage Murphy]YP_008052175.1 hypothetical protein M039_gp001 [Mycobacterium phage Phaux]YP_008409395.1 hypothetical protein DRDREY_2 [Mycobacterium phage DrDrey]YP_008410020.1 hypothetical protein PBI_CONTAGION_2 [Mycobacterium phage Contagion]YP_008857489.1 hypothetical protein PHATBACTER_2 [Mycobacterium phage PhatBacter]YP_008858282.1 hypothetical protein NALA_2 [Myco
MKLSDLPAGAIVTKARPSLRISRINIQGTKVPVTLEYNSATGDFKVTPVDPSLNDRQVLQ